MSAKGSASFTADDDAIGELLQSAAAMSHLEMVAFAALFQIRASAPKESGALSRSWYARIATVDGRRVALVGTRSPYWHLSQYGSAHNSPTRYIDKALTATGLRFDMSSGGERL